MTTFVNFNAANTHAKSCTNPKIAKFAKILNHVFKTSKKTQSYSRTYCKIYKIENIGKIGQSAVVVMAKRVIYYGSTRSTLSPPSRFQTPLIFLDESSISEKIEIITFEAFSAKIVKNRHFGTFGHLLQFTLAERGKSRPPMSKSVKNAKIGQF